jgi:TMEM175 potassium channel family protein
MPSELGDRNETARIEAFSDGVFAIAITLLVLDIKVPRELTAGDTLGRALARQWPAYLALVTSFATILIMWINHHRLFTLIGRFDHGLLFYNGLLLFGVIIVPFPTALVAEYLGRPGQYLAAAIYNGTFFVIAVFFNLLWRSASKSHRLIDPAADRRAVQAVTESYRWGPFMYVAAFALAFVSVTASLALNLSLAVYFALPGRASTE